VRTKSNKAKQIIKVGSAVREKTVKRGGTVMRGGAKKESKRSAGKHAEQCSAGQKNMPAPAQAESSKTCRSHRKSNPLILKNMPTG